MMAESITVIGYRHADMNNQSECHNVCQDLIVQTNKKLESSPESAYISQKVAIVRPLNDREWQKNGIGSF